jgi:GntR family transcriptional regulator
MSIGLAKVNRRAPIPLYHQVKRALLEPIEHGHWEAGHQLPNEAALAESFGVSKITVRQALQELATMGYVRREQGRGTFVSRPKLDKGPRELTSFTEEMRQHKLVASSRVISSAVVKADVRLAEKLDLAAGDPVFVLRRLRLADGEPMGIQTTHLPVALVPALTAEEVGSGSLYEVLRTRYGVAPHQARETYFAVAAEPGTASLLGIPAGSPVFAVERIALLPSGKPLEFAESIMRGDRYSIILDLSASPDQPTTQT